MLGVLAFSFTVPLTRIAVQHGAMSPLFVGSGRAVVAALLAAGGAADRRITTRSIATGADASEHHVAKAVARLVELGLTLATS